MVGTGRVELTTTSEASAPRRLAVVTVDQAVSGASNILAAVLAARILEPQDFGAFSLAFIVYGLVLAGSRSVLSSPVLMTPQESGRRLCEVAGAAWLFSIVPTVILLVIAAGLRPSSPDLAVALAILGLCTPLLIIQDLGRFIAIGLRAPMRALWLDLLWLGLLIASVLTVVLLDISSLATLMLAWAGSGAAAGVVALTMWGLVRARWGLPWLREHWRLSWRFAVSTVTGQLAVTVIAVIVLWRFGSELLGALVGAQLLLRVSTMAEASAINSGIAEVAHTRDEPVLMHAHVRRTTQVALLFAGVNAVAALALPDVIGRQVLGETWVGAQMFILPVAFQAVARSLAVGCRAGLVGTGWVDLTMWVGIATLVVMMCAVGVAAVTFGALAAAWAVAATSSVQSVVWWVLFRRKVAAASTE